MEKKLFKDINTKSLFTNAISLGATYRIACAYTKLNYFNFTKWIDTCEGQAFIEEMRHIKEYATYKSLNYIQKVALTDIQARKWLNKFGENPGLNYD